MANEPVKPIETIHRFDDGWSLLFTDGQVFLQEPMNGGHKALISHRVRDEQDGRRLHKILKEREQKAKRVVIEIPAADRNYMVSQLDMAIEDFQKLAKHFELPEISLTYFFGGLNAIGKVKTLLESA